MTGETDERRAIDVTDEAAYQEHVRGLAEKAYDGKLPPERSAHQKAVEKAERSGGGRL